jgi:hypothetical protein
MAAPELLVADCLLASEFVVIEAFGAECVP